MSASRPDRIGWHVLPNALTVLRIIAVGPIVWLLATQAYGLALILAAAAATTDGLDGYLARRFGWGSRIGGLLDPLADKLLQLSCFVMLALQAHIPLWLLGLVLGRDMVIVAGGTLYHLLIAPVDGEPTGTSKVNTILQLALILWILLDLSVVALPTAGGVALMGAVAATTVASGLQYVWVWGNRASTGRGGAGE